MFKHEHDAGLNRYAIANRNHDKIRLACPLIPSRHCNIAHLDPSDYGYSEPPGRFEYDVCFYGTQSSSLRPRGWRRVLSSDVSAIGGIQGHDIDSEVDTDVHALAVE